MRIFILVCVVGLIVSCAGNSGSDSPETRNSDVPGVADMTSPVDRVATVEVGGSDLVDSVAPPHETIVQEIIVDTDMPEQVAPGCAPGTPCDDGDPCTDDDQCTDDGGCNGTTRDCDDENPCTEDSCDDGDCKQIPLVAPCDDGNPCSVDDLCLDGECTAGLGELDCDDGNPCTDDNCVENVGCHYESNSAACDDGNLCTEGDICTSGACSPGPNKCGCLGEEDCAEVDDDNLCNGSLTCDESLSPPACVIDLETIVVCNDPAPNLCLAWTCNPATGKCITEPTSDGESCDDDDDCTTDDKCAAGECTGYYIPACGVGAPCVKWDDCVNGLTCFDGMPGGYCTMLNCKIAECPGGSQCSPINDGQLQVCMALCDSNSDCREEFGHGCTGGGGCWCGEEICQAEDPFCIGEVKGICNACGSTLEPDKVDCSLQDQFCYLGECVDCVPQCDGKECGGDGCDSLCGICQNGDICLAIASTCCTPDCVDKVCGADGCGGSCGECGELATCMLESGTCCTPDCQDKECGSNGCGGSCGPCKDPATCTDGVCTLPDPE
jgi:hypothetical protein